MRSTHDPHFIDPSLKEVMDKEARVFSGSDNSSPAVQLLSNGHYHVMASTAGGGYSHYNNIALTRWLEDSTRDNWGSFLYFRDISSGDFWSGTFQPTLSSSTLYESRFAGGCVTFTSHAKGFSSRIDLAVSGQDDIELRRIQVTNDSSARKILELTSYAEVVLAPAATDDQHPAFSKLFIQTEIVRDKCAILGHRRPGGGDQPAPWAFHMVVAGTESSKKISYETDRVRFIGRGNTVGQPAAMHDAAALSGTEGSVLDPIFSVRCPVALDAGQSATITFLSGVADSRDACLALIEKYQQCSLIEATFQSVIQEHAALLREFDISETDFSSYCRLTDCVLYGNVALRASSDVLMKNQRGQSDLWGYSISGDLPIVLLQLAELPHLELVSHVIQAHAYWRLKGLPVDLVICNSEGIDGRPALQDQVLAVVERIKGQAGMINKPGGVFVHLAAALPPDDHVLWQAVARIVLDDSRGTLTEQLDRHSSGRQSSASQSNGPQSNGFAGQPTAATDMRSPDVSASGWPSSRQAARRWGPDTGVPADTTDAADTVVIAGSQPSANLHANGLGAFAPDGREYVITLAAGQATPTPWVNVIANSQFGTIVSESGCASTWSENAHEFRLTPWSNDPVGDSLGEAFYLRDEESGQFWSPTPWPGPIHGKYICRHGFGYSIFTHVFDGIESELQIYVAQDTPIKFAALKVRNHSGGMRRLSATGYVEWVLGDLRTKTMAHVVTRIDPDSRALIASNGYNTDFDGRRAFFTVDDIAHTDFADTDVAHTVTGDRTEFLGRHGTPEYPAAMARPELCGKVGAGLDPCGAIRVSFELAAGDEREIIFKLGAAQNDAALHSVIERFKGATAAHSALADVKRYWQRALGAVQVETPDAALNTLTNGWLVYQTMACRLWARNAFYQSSGAFGFRDQLQDVMALVHTEPGLMRAHLLLCASRQFAEGDVQHWWHPPHGRGVRTRCSDDFLWLALATCRYVLATGDTGVLDETIHFLQGRPLKPDEASYYELPAQSDEAAPLYEHCVRAIRHGLRFGAHGLPLMGTGDWNDGMNKVGAQGKGESVWLGFFLYDILVQFSPFAQARGDVGFAKHCTEEASRLRQSLDEHGWDGTWFRRAYFDDGSVLGSAVNDECQIDSIAQSWAVLSKAASPDRISRAMESLDERLVHRDHALIQLLAPAFDISTPDPGYIKAYVPGVRENAGQYTHAAVWTVMAFAALKDKERALELLSILNPINHATDPEAVGLYKVEPYVIASDVYALPPHAGRGGWTWYSGSAGWMYRLIVESILGLRRLADTLYVEPCVPTHWQSFKISYRFGASAYLIEVKQAGAQGRKRCLSVDGVMQDAPAIRLVDDGHQHKVELQI